MLTSSEVYDWCYARKRKLTQRRRWSVYRILLATCDRLERVPPYGAWTWRLK